MKKVIGDPNYLTKKIPITHKYDDVKSTLNTGGNVLKLAQVNSMKSMKEEPFKRVKPLSLHRLMHEPEPEAEIILCDMRTAEEHKECHIDRALSFPVAKLSRSMNSLIPEVFLNKNKQGVFIVVYDWDETVAGPAAELLFQKGIDNVYLLSGGLKRYLSENLSGIIGTPPPLPKTPSVVSRSDSASVLAAGAKQRGRDYAARNQASSVIGFENWK